MEEHLVQGSSQWLSMRKSKISSTDAPVLMGWNGWGMTPYKLWQQKLGLIASKEENEAMKEGKRLEEEARQLYIEITGNNVSPQVVVHDKRNWQMSSLDGLNFTCERAVEIKCSKRYLTQALDGVVDDYTRIQCQHHLAVLDHDEIDLFCYWEEVFCLLVVKRDQEYIDQLIAKEEEFLRCINELEPPPLTDKDIVQRDDTKWKTLVYLWHALDEARKELDKHDEEVRRQLIEMAGNSPSEGAGLRVTPYMRKGPIQYGKVPQLQGIDLEPYRKESAICWRFNSTDKKDTND